MAEGRLPEGYMDAAAELIGLPIPEKYREGVRANLERIAEIAAPLLATEIPQDVESAHVFES